MQCSAPVSTGQVTPPPDLVALISAQGSRLHSICRRLCGPDDDPHELVQDTYVEIIRHLAGFRGEASFLTWATAVARSQLHRQRRRRRRFATRDGAIEFAAHSFPELLGNESLCPETQASNVRLRAQLCAALAELAPLDREVFLLRQGEGLTAPEVAQELGLSIAAVKSRLHRARLQLRTHLHALR